MKSRDRKPALSRRQFVTMLAAGSAALMASPLAVADAATRRRRRRVHASTVIDEPPGTTLADRKEIARQRKATADTLAVIRKHAMPPGTELAGIFRPLRSARRNG